MPGHRRASLPDAFVRKVLNNDAMDRNHLEKKKDNAKKEEKSCGARMKKVEAMILRAAIEEFGGVSIDDIDEKTKKDWKWSAVPCIMAFYFMLFIGVLLYVAYTGITSAYNTNSLSLTYDDKSQICKVVPQSVTGTYQASYTGFWQTNSSYNFNESIFQIEFMGSHIANEDFTKSILTFTEGLKALGEKAKYRSLAWSAIAMATYEFRNDSARLRLYSNVDAGILFDQLVVMATLSNANGPCNSFASTARYLSGKFDVGARQLVFEMPIVAPTNSGSPKTSKTITESIDGGGQWAAEAGTKTVSVNQTCAGFKPFIDYGDPFNAAYRSGTMEMKFDVRSIALAISLNLNITSLDGLLSLDASLLGFLGPFKAYSDPFYVNPPMTPILCYDKTREDTKAGISFTKAQIDGPEICFVQYVLGTRSVQMLFYPALGALKPQFNKVLRTMATARKVGCGCPKDRFNPACNYQDFYFGLLFDNYKHTPEEEKACSNLAAADPDWVKSGKSKICDPNLKVKQMAVTMQGYIVADPINGDIRVMDQFVDILAYTGNAYYNYGGFTKKIDVDALLRTDDATVLAAQGGKQKTDFVELLRGPDNVPPAAAPKTSARPTTAAQLTDDAFSPKNYLKTQCQALYDAYLGKAATDDFIGLGIGLGSGSGFGTGFGSGQGDTSMPTPRTKRRLQLATPSPPSTTPQQIPPLSGLGIGLGSPDGGTPTLQDGGPEPTPHGPKSSLMATRKLESCTSNSDCTYSYYGARCDTDTSKCIGCTSNSDCASSEWGKKCLGGSTPLCGCESNADCGYGQACQTFLSYNKCYSVGPTKLPTANPTPQLFGLPTILTFLSRFPTARPAARPSAEPTALPTMRPTMRPTPKRESSPPTPSPFLDAKSRLPLKCQEALGFAAGSPSINPTSMPARLTETKNAETMQQDQAVMFEAEADKKEVEEEEEEEDPDVGELSNEEILRLLGDSRKLAVGGPSSVSFKTLLNQVFSKFDYKNNIDADGKELPLNYQVGPNMGAFVFETYGKPVFTKPFLSINNYNMQLGDLTKETVTRFNKATDKNETFKVTCCSDLFYFPEAMTQLAAKPPVQLVQNYYECHPTWMTAFTSQIGNAFGSAQAAVGVILLVVGFFFVKIANATAEAKSRSKGKGKRKEVWLKSAAVKDEELQLLDAKQKVYLMRTIQQLTQGVTSLSQQIHGPSSSNDLEYLSKLQKHLNELFVAEIEEDKDKMAEIWDEEDDIPDGYDHNHSFQYPTNTHGNNPMFGYTGDVEMHSFPSERVQRDTICEPSPPADVHLAPFPKPTKLTLFNRSIHDTVNAAKTKSSTLPPPTAHVPAGAPAPARTSVTDTFSPTHDVLHSRPSHDHGKQRHHVDEVKREITELYRIISPEKVQEVPSLFAKYRGSEDEMLKNIRAKYAIQIEIIDIYRAVNPAKVEQLAGIFQKERGNEAWLLREVKLKYGAQLGLAQPQTRRL